MLQWRLSGEMDGSETRFEAHPESLRPTEKDETPSPAESDGGEKHQSSDTSATGAATPSAAGDEIEELDSNSGGDDQSAEPGSGTSSTAESSSDSEASDDEFDAVDFM